MSTAELIAAVLASPPSRLAILEHVLATGTAPAPMPTDRRLLTLSDAARALGLSRQTVFRMTRDGRLPTVEVRAGRCRVPSTALDAVVRGGAA